MINTKELKCPHCGNTVIVANDAKEVFCTYCGTKFETEIAKPNESAEKEAIVFIKNALQIGEYSEAASCADELVKSGTKDAIFESFALTAKIMDAYADYRVKADELYDKKASKTGIVRMFTGKDAYGDDRMHTEFFESIKKLCEELSESLEKLSVQTDGKREAAVLSKTVIAQALRKKSVKADVATYWMESALEHCIIGLIKFMETQELLQMYLEYRDMYARNEMLPNQTKTQKAMLAELLSRGAEVPKQKGFADAIKAFFGVH
ncbi:MAG: hypothetical protein RR009_07425 [Oscillospiraceae bacterium]